MHVMRMCVVESGHGCRVYAADVCSGVWNMAVGSMLRMCVVGRVLGNRTSDFARVKLSSHTDHC